MGGGGGKSGDEPNAGRIGGGAGAIGGVNGVPLMAGGTAISDLGEGTAVVTSDPSCFHAAKPDDTVGDAGLNGSESPRVGGDSIELLTKGNAAAAAEGAWGRRVTVPSESDDKSGLSRLMFGDACDTAEEVGVVLNGKMVDRRGAVTPGIRVMASAGSGFSGSGAENVLLFCVVTMARLGRSG